MSYEDEIRDAHNNHGEVVVHHRDTAWPVVAYHGSLTEHHGVYLAQPEPRVPNRFRLAHIETGFVLRCASEESVTVLGHAFGPGIDDRLNPIQWFSARAAQN